MGNNTQEQCYPSGTSGSRETNDRSKQNPIKNYNNTKLNVKEETNDIRCTHCDLLFLDVDEYEHHNITMHGLRKLITCELCNALFKRRDHLQRHMKTIHFEQKFLNCPVCGVDCKKQDILSSHIEKEHTSTTDIFLCRECTYTCNKWQKLEEHEMLHLSPQRHVCTHCRATFKRRDHMLRHEKSQHLNQNIICPVCEQRYKRKDHLVRHVRAKHKMGLLNGKLFKFADIVQQ
jgi:uncharacterized C2H2 Zn-finger protein